MNEELIYHEGKTRQDTRILIVEDSAIVSMQIKHILTRLNYTVAAVVSSGEQAMKAAENERFDLALMDIKLDGELDGIETASFLNKNYDVPVIFLTAYSDDDTFSRAKLSAPFGYLLKPFEAKELQNVVEMALYKHGIEKKLKQSEELYRTLIQSTHDGIIILSDGRIEFANAAFAEMLGHTPLELTGHFLKELIDKEYYSVLNEDFRDIEENNPRQTEYEISLIKKGRSGSLIAQINFNPAIYRNRKTVVCTVKDITESRKAQEILRRSEESLRLKLEQILSSSEHLGDVNLTELIDIKKLQTMQDSFAKSFQVASSIVDQSGETLTQPSNFTGFCQIVRTSPKGRMLCCESDKKMAEMAGAAKKPVIDIVPECGLFKAAVPLLVGGQHIATWLIGQIGTAVPQTARIEELERAIEVEPGKLTGELDSINIADESEFRRIVDMLSLIVLEISSLAYNNLVLNKELFHRKKTENELLKSEVKNDVILRAIPDLLFQVSINGEYRCLKLSDAGEYPFLYSKDSSNKLREDFPEEIAELLLKNVVKAIATNAPQRLEFTYEIESVNNYYEARIALLDEDETLVMIRNISDKKRAEDELIRAKEQAESSDRLKSEFLAQMSHEIRTPINAILNFSSLLKEELEDKMEEGHAESFTIIDKAGRRLIRTIDEILQMSQLQTGNYELIPEELDLAGDILEKLLRDYRYIAKEKKVELCFEDRLDRKEKITADRHMVDQIFANIIDNAVKYTIEGTVKVVQYKNNENNLCVDVEDTGIGMSDEYIKKLFTPFSQEESGYTRRYEGNGLGLAIVKRYAELNNAAVSVESRKGTGSVFTVIFK
ncbi:MAG: PocR ligand-binding domain-containing protein [Syntrophothermus sp.]